MKVKVRPDSTSVPPAAQFSSWERPLHILCLVGLAIAQPIFDLLARHVDFFVIQHSTTLEVVFLAAFLSLVLPGLISILCEVCQFLSMRMRAGLHTLAVASLHTLLFMQVLKRIDTIPDRILVLTALFLGIIATSVYYFWKDYRSFLSILSPACLIFPLLFLFVSPLSGYLWSSASSSNRNQGAKSSVPVVMVIFDELPLASLIDQSATIDAKLYPNFAALAKDAYWFRNASTVSDQTRYAVPAILTGQYPRQERDPIAQDYPDNLFSWLGSTPRFVFESSTQLCPRTICQESNIQPLLVRMDSLIADSFLCYLHLLLPEGMAAQLPALSGGWDNFGKYSLLRRLKKMLGLHARSAPSKVILEPKELFRAFVDQIQKSPTRGLYFTHLMLPHVPWKYLPDGKEYGPLGAPLLPHGRSKGEKWSQDEWEVMQGLQRHLLQVGYVDNLVGQLVQTLKETDLYESCLLIITADHGLSFRPGENSRDLTDSNAAEILRIPLLIKTPGNTQAVWSDQNVETIDILPSIADILNLEIPWAVDGESVFDSRRVDRGQKTVYTGDGRLWTLPPRLDDSYDGNLRRKWSWFEPGSGTKGLFALGPNRRLIGRKVSELLTREDSRRPRIKVTLDDAWAFHNYAPKQEYVPVHITGELTSEALEGKPRQLTISINGTIQAVTRSFDNEVGRGRFSAIVPEAALTPGLNLVEVWIIQKQLDLVFLEPTQKTEPRFTLVQVGDQEQIVTGSGQRIPLSRRVLLGDVALSTNSWGNWISGSATSPDDVRPVLTLGFFGQHCVYIEPTQNDPYMNPIDPLEPETFRFRFRIPQSLPEMDDKAIKIFFYDGESVYRLEKSLDLNDYPKD